MSVFAASAPQIWTMETRIPESQFHAVAGRCCLRVVSRPGTVAKRRNALAALISRYKALGGNQSVPGRYCAMRAILAILFLCTAFAGGAALAEPSAETIARGKALTNAGDCASCHTADPAKPFAGGKRIDTPFGGIYTPNLTPDRDTGLGDWSEGEFYRALRFGIAKDGSRYYPAFPYPFFTKMTRQNISAIRAYLATLTPFRN